MSREDMLSHKFQIAIEGRGATFDALFSKLTSNSVVFVVHTQQVPGGPPGLLHHQWLTPLLQPRVNYINTTFEQLRADVDWCADHGNACQSIATKALQSMQPLLGDQALVHYMQLTLEVCCCSRAACLVHETWLQALAEWSGQAVRTPPSESQGATMLHLPAWDHLPVVPRNDSDLLQQLPGMSLPGASGRERSATVYREGGRANSSADPGNVPVMTLDVVPAGV